MSNNSDPDQARYFVGPYLGPKCLQRLSADNKSGQRVKYKKKLVDTTFWLKPWLKLISFGYNFFHLAKVLATTNSEPELALSIRGLCSNRGPFPSLDTINADFSSKFPQKSSL